MEYTKYAPAFRDGVQFPGGLPEVKRLEIGSEQLPTVWGKISESARIPLSKGRRIANRSLVSKSGIGRAALLLPLPMGIKSEYESSQAFIAKANVERSQIPSTSHRSHALVRGAVSAKRWYNS
jgi:hypothetical protein